MYGKFEGQMSKSLSCFYFEHYLAVLDYINKGTHDLMRLSSLTQLSPDMIYQITQSMLLQNLISEADDKKYLVTGKGKVVLKFYRKI